MSWLSCRHSPCSRKPVSARGPLTHARPHPRQGCHHRLRSGARAAAFITSGMTAVAYFLVHAPKTFMPIANGGELAALYCFVFFYLVFAGGGPISLDKVLFNRS